MITPATEILNQKGTPMFNSDLFANRPAAGIQGRIFISTDTKEFYRDTGTAWELLSAGGGGTVTGTGSATQVAFWTGSSAISGNNDLWWDNVNDYLGIKTNSPISELDVVGQGYFHPSVTASANAGWASSYAFTTATIPATTFSNLGNVFCGAAGVNSMTYNGDATFQQANVPAAVIGNNIFSFGSSGLTISLNQGSGLRAFSALTAFNQVQSNFVGTITHLAGVHVLSPYASNQSMNVTNYYGLLINNATERTAFTITNRWGIYQDGALDRNYFAGRVLVRSNVDNGAAMQVTGITSLNGNVGIRNPNPSALLDIIGVSGQTAEVSIFGTGGGNPRLKLMGSGLNDCQLYYNRNLNIFAFNTNVSALQLDDTGAATFSSSITAGDNITISTGAGTYPRFISTVGAKSWEMGYRSGTTNYEIREDGNTRLAISNGGNVGIGIANPVSVLDVRAAIGAGQLVQLANTSGFSNSNTLEIGFALANSNTGLSNAASIGVTNPSATGNNYGDIYFKTAFASTTLTERMRITSGGNVLIGSATDTGNKLYLNGSLRIDGQRSGTAGGNSGQHLIITLDGIQYKIALLNP